MDIEMTTGMDMSAGAAAGAGVRAAKQLENRWHVECHDKDGLLKWVEEFDNLVTTAGLNDSLDKHLKGSNYTAAWYVGLTSATPTVAAGDTMASHAGWTEVAAYDEAVRQTLTLGSVAAGSVDNTASKAVFTISTNGTAVGGAFVASVSTKSDNTGTLYGGGAFTGGNKTLSDGDTLTVTVTLTAAAA
jgi:hypothetical protein